MTDTISLMNLVADIIMTAKTTAADRIYTPGDWATFSGQYPCVLIRPAAEERESLGRSAPQFTTTATMELSLRTTASTTDFTGSGLQAELDVWALKRQIEIAVINNPQIMPLIQQFPFTRAEFKISAEGETHIAELLMHLGIEFFEGTNSFAPLASAPLQKIGLTMPAYPTLSEVFDVPQT